ncbi:hypothetical protein FACS189447_09450 [Spirochaetia bacterium]|nr:hypothetical protein FACS189447_09450 [Spirochaetia bacterium]
MEYDFSNLPLIRVNSRYLDREFPLHSLSVLTGRSRETQTSYYNDGKRKDLTYYSVWQYTTSGRGKITVKEKSRDVLPGTMMLVSVPGDHVYFLPADSDHWEFVFLVMVGRDASRAVKTVESHKENLIDAEEIPGTMGLFYSLVQDLFAKKIDNSFINSSRSYAVCMSLMEETIKPGHQREKQSFGELLVLIQDNLYRDISVDEMAEMVNLSRSHFTRLFSRAMGLSPRKYLEDLRLKIAMDILCSENIKIIEAAHHVGIYDVNYFCRIFKKRYGVSPGKYREGHYRELPST